MCTDLLPNCWNSTPTFQRQEFLDPHPFSHLLNHSQIPSQSCWIYPPSGIYMGISGSLGILSFQELPRPTKKNLGEIQKCLGEFPFPKGIPEPGISIPCLAGFAGMGNSQGSPVSISWVGNEILESGNPWKSHQERSQNCHSHP